MVVASHPAVTDEVCFRLGEDANAGVRLNLRKNSHCHPLVRAALLAKEDRNHTLTELLLEMSWQARRCDLLPKQTVELIEDWTGVRARSLYQLEVEQAHLMLDVLAAQLGQGPMPRKPRRARKTRKK